MNFLQITGGDGINDLLINIDAVAAFKTSPNTGKTRFYMRNGQKDLTATQDFELEVNYSDVVAALQTVTVTKTGT